MNYIALYFASGQSFFSGFAMIIAGVALSWRDKSKALKAASRLLMIIGGIFILISSTPFPGVFFRIFAIAAIALLVGLEFESKTLAMTNHFLRIVVIFLCLYSIRLESRFRRMPTAVPGYGGYDKLFIIGDSLTAGIGYKGEKTWVDIIKEKNNFDVFSFASGGATLDDAVDRADLVFDKAAPVVLLIGGNDILRSVSSEQFMKNLDTVLTKLKARKRSVIMFELPLPPFHTGYGQAQRQMATKHKVTLIPKQVLSDLFRDPDNLHDGLHFSNQGHQKLADTIWPLIAPLM